MVTLIVDLGSVIIPMESSPWRKDIDWINLNQVIYQSIMPWWLDATGLYIRVS